MIRIHVICEGQTEETFVNQVLAETFSSKDINLYPALIGKPGHKGGNVSFERLFTDVRNRLLGDRNAWCTTFFDFYGLREEFPGKKEASTIANMDNKADIVLRAMTNELQARLGEEPLQRFIPYIQMYEFEGLLFSDPRNLAKGINQAALEEEFEAIRNSVTTPEWINNSVETAPSKRILNLYRGYDKPTHGSLAALEIGLTTIRNECARFGNWLNRMESLS
jgi:hypothetical protein